MTRIDILVQGTLSVEEIRKLVQCIREIEQNMPERVIEILVDAPEKKVEELKEVIDSIKPGFPYKMVLDLKKAHRET